MAIVLDKINPNLLKAISRIAKRENTTEEAIINESLQKTIEEKEIAEEKLKYPDGMPVEVVAEEFGETPEEFIKSLEEAEAEESIPLDVNELEKELGL